MRPPEFRIGLDEIIVDSFAGGGGASTGIEMALNRSPDIAINHDDEALAMHATNHPNTRHLHGNIWDVDPIKACGGRRVGLLWASPDCTHFSKAKGGKPKNAKRRALAWVIVRWARAVKPRIILMENVEEWLDWGPLDNDGQPDPRRKGLTFRIWLGKLKAAGYAVEMRELRACDYGAPTSRNRLFVIARSDGLPIVWPTPTHGRHRLPYRTASECIDWSRPCPSIFERSKPLADATLKRVALGIERYVIGREDPFLAPSIPTYAPTMIQTGYGEREGQSPRVLDLDKPLGTIVASGAKHAIVAAFLAKHYTGVVGQSLSLPLGTITTQDHHSLVGVSTIGAHQEDVRAFLMRYQGKGIAQLPFDAFTRRSHFGSVRVHGTEHAIADIGLRMLSPRELFRAQGFPDSYVIDKASDGRIFTLTSQIRLCGNSVSPWVAAAIVRANTSSASEAAA